VETVAGEAWSSIATVYSWLEKHAILIGVGVTIMTSLRRLSFYLTGSPACVRYTGATTSELAPGFFGHQDGRFTDNLLLEVEMT
jgi:hypothetical protein